MSAAERAQAGIEAARVGATKETLHSLGEAVIELRCANPLFAAGYCESGGMWNGASAATEAKCRAAASACVEAWQESRPVEELRAEAIERAGLLALALDTEGAGSDAEGIRRRIAVGDAARLLSFVGTIFENGDDLDILCENALEAIIRWRRAERQAAHG